MKGNMRGKKLQKTELKARVKPQSIASKIRELYKKKGISMKTERMKNRMLTEYIL